MQSVDIDLEHPRRLSYQEDDFTRRDRPFAYELKKGESAVFLVSATTKDDVEWRLYLDLVVGEEAVTYDINRLVHADEPYRTTGQCSAIARYAVHQGEPTRVTYGSSACP